MRETENLSRHEQLRLDYLHTNYYYLNEHEKEEYQYLRQKSTGRPDVVQKTSTKQTVQASPEDSKMDSSGLLPKYPGKGTLSRSQKNSRASLKQEAKKSTQKTPRTYKRIRPKRVLMWLLIFVLLVVSGMLFMFFKGLNTARPGNLKAADVEYFDGHDARDGINILVLGTDGRIGENSTETRTDSIMVLNVGNKDHKMKLVSFMRDTLIHIDGVSNSYTEPTDDDYYDQKLNSAYTFGEQDNHRGAEAVRQALKDNFDIDIKYYALVDFNTFATAIDTLFPNGVFMDAKFSTIDGEKVTEVEVPDDLNMKDGVVPTQTIKVGRQHMDGRTLLNYFGFSLLFILFRMLLHLLMRVLNLFTSLPIIHGINQIAGAVLGLAEGFFFLWFGFILLNLFQYTPLGSGILERIEATGWLTFLYQNNLLLTALGNLWQGLF